MEETEYESAFDMPEETLEQVVNKIEAMAWQIRNDWSDPRSECRSIVRLSSKVRELSNLI